MVIDTSALIAITLREPSREALLTLIARTPTRVIASVSLLEAGMVLRARSGEKAVPILYELMDALGVEVAPFDVTHAKLAITAFERFGKGMGHRAQLNFGDCTVYALAALRGEPVLATGNDFAATDLNVLRF
jgi:ribonuclease VapC